MPLDASIPLAARTFSLGNPFAEAFGQGTALRAQLENATALREDRKARTAIAEEEAKRKRDEEQRAAAFRALWNRTDPGTGQPLVPTLEETASHVGPENAAKIFEALEALKTKKLANQTAEAARLASIVGGLNAWPTADRPKMYTDLRAHLIDEGSLKPGDAPTTFSQSWVNDKLRQAMTAQQQMTLDAPKPPIHVGDQLVDPATMKPVFTAPEKHSPALTEYNDAVAQGYKGTFQQYQTEDANRRRPVTNINATGEGLDAGGQDLLATQYRLQGASAIPTRISGADRAKIINMAAAQMKAVGQTPAAAIQKQFALKSDAKSLDTITRMASTSGAFENKALQQADLVRELSEKVDRTQMPILNRALLAGKKDLLGDANTQLLYNAITTFTSEYAKIIEGSTGSAAGSSDAARKASASLANSAMNKATLAKTLDLMQKEMRYTIQGYDATRDMITARMGGTPQAVAPTAPASESLDHRVWRVGGKIGPEPK